MKRIFSFLLVLLVAVFYVACGSSPKSATPSASPSSAQAMTQETAVFDNKAAGADTGSALKEQQLPRDERKIIYDTTLHMEANDFAATQKALNEALKAAKGYASSSSLENDSYEGAMRYATYVYRIPADQYTNFLTALDGAGNVTSQEESTQDITAEYVDVQARLKSLKTQEERLMEMLAQAGTLDTMLAIQNQLTEVQYRIESFTAQQRTFDDLVEYCTVTVRVQEVKHITESKITFGNRVGAAFHESWRDFGEGCKSFAVGFVYFLPTLLVLAVLGTIAFFLVRFINKRTENRRVAMTAHRATMPVQPQSSVMTRATQLAPPVPVQPAMDTTDGDSETGNT